MKNKQISELKELSVKVQIRIQKEKKFPASLPLKVWSFKLRNFYGKSSLHLVRMMSLILNTNFKT